MTVPALLAVLLLAPPASAAQTRVLYIGDSHSVGIFGKTLGEELRAVPGVVLAQYASCGSRPQHWFSGTPTSCGYYEKDADGNEVKADAHATPLLETLLDSQVPELTVVALGANQIGFIKDSTVYVERQARRLAKMIKDRGGRCVWVGPPHGRNKPKPLLDELYRRLEKGAKEGGDCVFLDSRPWAPYPEDAVSGDGRHFDWTTCPPSHPLGKLCGREIAKSWAKKVAAAVAAKALGR